MDGYKIKGLGDLDQTYDGSQLRICIVHARWNATIIEALIKGAINRMLELGVKQENIDIISVPGSYELPYGVFQASESQSARYDAYIAIGTLIKGSTMHFEYICEHSTRKLMDLQFELRKPIIFGILTCLTEDQALLRCGLKPGMHNHGCDWGAAAVEMGIKNRNVKQ